MTFVDIRDDLLEEDKETVRTRKLKCRELELYLNGVPVITLIDTGSQINAISAEWFNKNKNKMEKLNLLRLTNTIVKGAVGKKSKQITQQILVEVKFGMYVIDSVFIIVPDLIRDCIMGIELLQEGGCIINLHNNQITFNNHVTEGGVPERSEMLTMEVYQGEGHTTTMI